MPDTMTPGGSAQGSQHWCTPPEVVELVHRVFGGPPDFDPFSNAESVTGAHIQYSGPTPEELQSRLPDGCSLVERCGWAPWPDVMTAFGNPRWKDTNQGPEVYRDGAIHKFEYEWLRKPGRQVIGLFPAGPNCSAWPIVLRAPARCFPYKRIAFLENGAPKKGNPKDVVIVYWGHDQYRFRAVFRELGEVVFG